MILLFYIENIDLVLGLIWQIVKSLLLQDVSLNNHPELIRLLNPNEAISSLVNLSSEQLLLRWVNYHLQRAGESKKILNFSKDISDSEVCFRSCSKFLEFLLY